MNQENLTDFILENLVAQTVSNTSLRYRIYNIKTIHNDITAYLKQNTSLVNYAFFWGQISVTKTHIYLQS